MASNCSKLKLFPLVILLIIAPLAWIKTEHLEELAKYTSENETKVNVINHESRKKYGSTNSSDVFQSMFPNAKGTLEDYVADYLLKPPSNKSYNIKSFTSDYRFLVNSQTWKPINEYVRHLFDNQTSGFFIEAGALDGVALSNSLWLETEKNWTGLLAEPDKVNYLALTKKNRKAWTINACLSTSPTPKIATLKSIRPAKHDSGQTGNFWFFHGRSNVMDEFDSEISSQHYRSDFSRVLCLPIGLLLKTLNVTVVDFLSLDIEGKELEVLETFPFETVKLRALVVEYVGFRKRPKSELIEVLGKKGYVFIDAIEEIDFIFILKTETTLLQKVKNIKKHSIST